MSGNPGGRPKDTVGHLVRASGSGEKCYKLLLEAVEGKLPGIRARDRISGAQYLIDRGYGKAPQEIIHGQTDNHTGVFDHLPMTTLQGLLKVFDTLESPEQLDELIRIAQAPVVEGKGGALELEQGPEE